MEATTASAAIVDTPVSGENTISSLKSKGNAKKYQKSNTRRTGSGNPSKPIKKSYKVSIRKLPARDFSFDDFKAIIDGINSQLSPPGSQEKLMEVEHFIDGKVSRKRGPLSSAGFVAVRDLNTLTKFLSTFPHVTTFIEDNICVQPDIALAPYTKCFKTREIFDKLDNTYEVDAEYLRFMEQQQQTQAVKKPSLESQLEALKSAVNNSSVNMSENALVKFLREKSSKSRNSEKSKKKAAKNAKANGGGTKVIKKSKKTASGTTADSNEVDPTATVVSSETTTKPEKRPRKPKDKTPREAPLSSGVAGPIKRPIKSQPQPSEAQVESSAPIEKERKHPQRKPKPADAPPANPQPGMFKLMKKPQDMSTPVS